MKIETVLRQVSDIAVASGLQQPYLVGGAVRDMILGRTPKDYDITCGSADSLKLAVVVGRHFGSPIYRMKSGSVKVLVYGHELDFSPCVVYGGLPENLQSECRSRDFTINSVMMNLATGEIVDMFGGIGDIQGRRLRPCDAALFASDPIRSYRALKYIADGFQPDDHVIAFIKATAAQDSRHAKSLLNEAIRRNPDIIDFMVRHDVLRSVPVTKLLITSLKNRRQIHLC